MSGRLKPRGMLLSAEGLCQLDQELEEAGKLSQFLEISTSLGLETFLLLEFLPSRGLFFGCSLQCCHFFHGKITDTCINKNSPIPIL